MFAITNANDFKMKKKILSIGASNSSKSINKKLADFVAAKIENSDVAKVDLNHFELPVYSIDLENESGIPENAYQFLELIKAADGIVMSLAEHNGLPTVAFKNLYDWMSRIDQKFWHNKPILLMATSPGARGGMSALGIMKNLIPFTGGRIITDFSLPSFYDNFSEEGIQDESLQIELKNKIKVFDYELNK